MKSAKCKMVIVKRETKKVNKFDGINRIHRIRHSIFLAAPEHHKTPTKSEN